MSSNIVSFVVFLCFICISLCGYADDISDVIKSHSFARFDDVLFSVYVYENNNPDALKKKASFVPSVDLFSEMIITNSGSYYKNLSASISAVQIEVEGVTSQGVIVSEKRFYIDLENTPLSFVGFFTAIVQINNGVMERIYWDDGCGECDQTTSITEQRCIADKNCGILYDGDGLDCTVPGNCDISVYLAWIGTDNSGVPMNSISSIPSRFSEFSFNPVYKAAAGVSEQYFINDGATPQ